MKTIPRIIHQTAKTTEIPPQWQIFQKRVQDFHPNWEYRLWTDKDNDALVAAYFPALLNAYRGLPKGIMRADIIRYVIMYQFGGWYLDLDYEMLQPFPVNNYEVILPRESADDEIVRIGNSIFASVPGHDFWNMTLDTFHENHPGPLDTPTEQDVLQLTGPGLLTKVLQQNFMDDKSIFLPPQRAFNPLIPRDNRAYEVLRKDQAVYGIHHCHGTWRALTFRQRLSEKLQSAYMAFRRSIQKRGK